MSMSGKFDQPEIVPMTATKALSDGRQIYCTRFAPSRNGEFIYGVRIRPHYPAQVDSNETGLMIWAQ